MEHAPQGFEPITIAVPPTVANALRAAVASGDYTSADEAIGEALRDWARMREAEERSLDDLRGLIRDGVDSGPSIPADRVYAELNRIVEEQAALRA